VPIQHPNGQLHKQNNIQKHINKGNKQGTNETKNTQKQNTKQTKQKQCGIKISIKYLGNIRKLRKK
jgi:hypothetical protein